MPAPAHAGGAGVVSCGVVIVTPLGDVFACRATGRGRWDLPKGLPEPGETPREAALREAAEEAGLILDPAHLADLGIHDYLPKKRLHLFGLRVAADAIDLARCRCRSTFVDARSGRVLPEVSGYAWQPLGRLDAWCGKNLSRVLAGIDQAALRRLPEIAGIGIIGS
ncbi:MAG: NUDIX domain-containing protein [Proteobacteria bacterium]|nr:NUDIX domain-containing protein [Pseudomonadota bacterium]